MDEKTAFDTILPNFSSHAAGPEHGLRRVRDEGSADEQQALQALMARVPEDVVEQWELNEAARRFIPAGSTLSEAARFATVVDQCSKECYQRRLTIMANQRPGSAPAPYGQQPFDALELDDDSLVCLDDLKDFRTVLLYQDWIAHLASTTGATNDTHWLLPAVINLGVRSQTRVRLDPFVIGPKESFPMIMQKMTVYGKPLDWDSLSKIRDPLVGQFENFDGFGPKVRTDYQWMLRDNELHFEAEEVPHAPEGKLSSGRYFHAIYDKSISKITHFDGAVRVYDVDGLTTRRATHLSKLGKVGNRAKIFRVDVAIDRDAFSDVAKCFFLWNQDLQHYFDGEVRQGYL